MKKLLFAASMFIAISASAQQRFDDRRDDRRDIRKQDKMESRQNDALSNLRLTASQQRKVDALNRERISPKEYDFRLQHILTKQQFSYYLSFQQNSFGNDKRLGMNKGYRNR